MAFRNVRAESTNLRCAVLVAGLSERNLKLFVFAWAFVIASLIPAPRKDAFSHVQDCR